MKKKIALTMVLSVLFLSLLGCSQEKDSNGGVNYTITFNSRGGTNVAPIKKPSGTVVYAPPAPTKQGNNFGGWYTSSTLSAKVSWPVQLNENKIFYAGWIERDSSSYTITFNSNGGSSVSPITMPAGSLVYAPGVPKKSGYSFDGWYTSSTLYTKVSWPVTLNSNQTYYAGWGSGGTTSDKTVTITSSNFSTYFALSAEWTNISNQGMDGSKAMFYNVNINAKSPVKSISYDLVINLNLNVSFTATRSNGQKIYENKSATIIMTMYSGGPLNVKRSEMMTISTMGIYISITQMNLSINNAFGMINIY